MNCKDGDLAVIVKSDSPKTDCHIGMVVVVSKPMGYCPRGEICWTIHPPINDSVGKCIGVADAHLRPIRGEKSEETKRDVIKELDC